MSGPASIAQVRMWAFEITRHWSRNDGGPTTTADRLRWADELTAWVLREDDPPPAFPAAPAMRMAVGA